MTRTRATSACIWRECRCRRDRAQRLGLEFWVVQIPAQACVGIDAGVAQLVEQRIRNAKVNSSIPFTGTKY
jgi:hypothetical protein